VVAEPAPAWKVVRAAQAEALGAPAWQGMAVAVAVTMAERRESSALLKSALRLGSAVQRVRHRGRWIYGLRAGWHR
jgi:hypothetical protein